MFKRALPRVLPAADTLLTRAISRRPQNPTVKLSPLTRATWRHPQSIRHGSTTAVAKKIFKENPFSVTLASVIILAGLGGLFYAGFIYQTYIIGDFEDYPEEVANKLRRALYYHHMDLQPQNALKYYQQALELSEKIGMDPFSAAILGVKLQVAELMEDTHNPLKAIEVLSLIHADCLRWLETFGDKPGNEGRRTRVLESCVRMSVRIGQLYSSDAVNNAEAAEKHLGWAVTVLLRECKRRELEGVKESEGDWMNHRETSFALAELGNQYFSNGQYSLAYPLFLHAINLVSQEPCFSVLIMTNIAICLAQQQNPSTQPGSRLALAADARMWAKKALALAPSIPPEEKRRGCKEAFASANLAMGDITMTAAFMRDVERRSNTGSGMQGEERMGMEAEERTGTEKDERAETKGDGQTETVEDGDLDEGDWDGFGDAGGEEAARKWFERALKAFYDIGDKEGMSLAIERLRTTNSKN